MQWTSSRRSDSMLVLAPGVHGTYMRRWHRQTHDLINSASVPYTHVVRLLLPLQQWPY